MTIKTKYRVNTFYTDASGTEHISHWRGYAPDEDTALEEAAKHARLCAVNYHQFEGQLCDVEHWRGSEQDIGAMVDILAERTPQDWNDKLDAIVTAAKAKGATVIGGEFMYRIKPKRLSRRAQVAQHLIDQDRKRRGES